jgi:hypothetical protein
MNTNRLSAWVATAGLMAWAGAAAAQTPGTATFTVTTVSTGEKYAPRHVLAIWVTDASDRHVCTLLARAKNQIKWLSEWGKAAGEKGVDAVSGATLKEHQTHAVTWDGRGADGAIAPDGLYRIRVEFTEKNGEGPVTPPRHIQFMKGAAPVTLKPKELPGFNGMQLDYAPAKPQPG